MRSYKVITFGCQMNEHDTEKISGVLAAEGYNKAETVEDADLVLLNTCSIREKAEQKFYSELGKLRLLKLQNPALMIAVSGCIAQQEAEKVFKRAPHVDLVFGNQNIKDLPFLIQKREAGIRMARTAFEDGYEHHSLPVGREAGITAFVNIMYGCDNFCAYCVVPYVRGREKSRRPEEIVGEITALAANGCKEVTLLGQNVNSYGRGLEAKCSFPELLAQVNEIKGVERVRFVTSHPKDLSGELVEAMASLPKVCESIHLPVQSASDRILRAMNRKYTFAEYMEKLEKLRSAMPDIHMTTDIIVGFPGETDEDYGLTFKALEDIRYDSIFSFKYSKRPNTAALKLSGHLPEDVKAERLDAVIELQNRITVERNASRVGRVEEVLVEGPDRSDVPGRLTGRSRGGKIVNFAGGPELIGKLVNVKITEGKKHSLIGESLSEQ